jgi:hypothetical protein
MCTRPASRSLRLNSPFSACRSKCKRPGLREAGFLFDREFLDEKEDNKGWLDALLVSGYDLARNRAYAGRPKVPWSE